MEGEKRSKEEKTWARLWGEKCGKKSEKGRKVKEREGKRRGSKEIEGKKGVTSE